ncbi:raffinose/stachyose/melibiose transport system permease protein [Nonomuraea thailandensis]|uniref:Raffinose/stachyose/melibiose transport system permease protein n=1 Tax=Nonomuraea thailandensis TaxID=1188745 RepID=A0A9X2G6Q8_9ACTN|nr:sugar ABC transporter permease [Nonomuraea thailandensis]MCP2353594.1 raffinose/stachyose/melibiose transport system permease protein [Nonomuraea thailandensis]
MAALTVRRSSTTRPLDLQRRRLTWLFVTPALLLYAVFLLVPTIASLWISLHAWDGLSEMTFKGLGNYLLLLEDRVFLTSSANTLILLLGGGLLVFVLSFALTMVLRDMAGRRFARAVLFFPNIVAPVVLSVLWGFLFQTDGLLNAALRGAGVDHPPNWLGDHLFLLIFAGLVWVNTGFYVTILMAGVDRIPRYFYEDCALNGATALERLRHVTIPLTWDVIATSAVIWTVGSLKIFEFIYAFGGTTNDLPPTAVWNSALFIYGQTFGGRVPQYAFGYAAASSVVTLLFIAVFVALLRRLTRRDRVQF